ncbi:MAG: replication initiator protein A [Desulfobacterales bacterium]|nr:replication initiator protein A [Desulfobacterales bacterium]
MNDLIKQDINFLDKPLWFQNVKHDGLGFVWKDIEGYEYRTGYTPPDKVDILILLCLLLKSQQNEYQCKIKSSKYEILKRCNYPTTDQKYYERLEDSLKRWKNVAIEFKGTFYDGHNYSAIGFGILNDYEIDKATNRISVHFNEKWLLQIQESTFFKYINFEYFKALKRPLSRRLFEILCKTFKERNTWSIGVVKLGAKLPIFKRKIKIKDKIEYKEVIYASDVITAINPCIKEINLLSKTPGLGEKFGIHPDDLFTVSHKITGLKQDRVIHFTKIPIDQKAITAKKVSNLTLNELYNLVPFEEKEKESIKKLIEKYSKQYGEDYVRRNIDYANKNSKTNYHSYLSKALESDWGLSSTEKTKKIVLKEGMFVEFKGIKCRIEENIVLRPYGEDGGTVPEGDIRKGIREGLIKIL